MYYVYILRCADGTLYTGYTPDLTARLAAHNSGKGAKYTRGRGPLELVFSEVFDDRGEALGYEAALKALTREEKLRLIESQNDPTAEYLTVFDRSGNPCGTRPRTIVHRQGLRHAVVHLWVIERRAEGAILWLQQRADDRPLYPGRFDLTATGHIDPGETPLTGVCREAREEVGIAVSESALLAAKPVRQFYPRPDGGTDDELAHAFLYLTDTAPDFAPGNEVASMLPLPLADYTALIEGAAEITLPDGAAADPERFCCLHTEEWKQIRKLLREQNLRL